MTSEQMTNLECIRNECVKLAQERNEILTGNAEEEHRPLARVVSDLTEQVAKFNEQAKVICFENLYASDDPMCAACMQYSYKGIQMKTEKNEAEIEIITIEDKDVQIDLLSLNKYSPLNTEGKKAGIGHGDWTHRLERMNQLLTADVAYRLGCISESAAESLKAYAKDKPELWQQALTKAKEEYMLEVCNSYYIEEISRKIELGETPFSNTNFLRTLQDAINVMLGQNEDGPKYKATSHDVEFLKEVYSKKGKGALTVAVSNHKKFAGYMMDICHRILTGGHYQVSYKTKKK